MTYSFDLERENDVPFTKWNAPEQAPSTGHKKKVAAVAPRSDSRTKPGRCQSAQELCL
jgi:hypothetical protein